MSCQSWSKPWSKAGQTSEDRSGGLLQKQQQQKRMALPLSVFVLLAFTGFMIMFAFIMLAGDMEVFERTPIGWANQKLYDISEFWYSDKFRSTCVWVCGKRNVERIDWVQNYLFNKPNPILPTFYVFLVVSGFAIFVMQAFPHIPMRSEEPWGISAYHKPNAFIIIGFCVLTFYKACFTDAGLINDDNMASELERYPMDNVIYSDKECSTCILSRPARSKHCSICDKCIARFDHHCPWINNCVGLHNVKWFILFLFSHAVLCVYGGILLLLILRAIIKDERIYEMFVRDPKLGAVKVTHSHAIRWILQKEAPLVGLAFGLVCIGAVLAGFVGYHLYLAGTNITTNESFKLKRITRCRKRHAWQKAQEEGGKWQDHYEGTMHRYDNGVWLNFREVFFPVLRPTVGNGSVGKRGVGVKNGKGGVVGGGIGGGGGGGGGKKEGKGKGKAKKN